MAWLRGVDLNHRHLGYEAIDLLLSSSIDGTSGIVRNRKEASGERFGSRMGVGFDRLRLWVYGPNNTHIRHWRTHLSPALVASLAPQRPDFPCHSIPLIPASRFPSRRDERCSNQSRGFTGSAAW